MEIEARQEEWDAKQAAAERQLNQELARIKSAA